MELDQREANVCIWEDASEAEEVPFKNIVDWDLEKQKQKKVKV